MSEGSRGEERLELLDAISDLLPKSDRVDRVKLVNAIEDVIAARVETALKAYSLRVEDATGIRP
jgi:hypothetical protein